MASTQSQFDSQLANFWQDDFAPLQAAGQAILTALRHQESASDADLYGRVAGSGAHHYFASQRWKHTKSEPLPPLLQDALLQVQSHSLMGLLAPAGLAWMSVDHKLWLWYFSNPQGPVICFEVPGRQCVVSVGLVKPKKGESSVCFGFVDGLHY